MKAADLKPGDIIRSGEWEGWRVADVFTLEDPGWLVTPACEDEFVLLTLEITSAWHFRSETVETITRRTWLRNDEEIES